MLDIQNPAEARKIIRENNSKTEQSNRHCALIK